MRAYLTLVRREVGTFFVSMTGYAIIASVLLVVGFSFTDMLTKLNDDTHGAQAPMTDLFYSTFYFWLILRFTPPVIKMRSFDLEEGSGIYTAHFDTRASGGQ